METTCCDYCGNIESTLVARQTDKLHNTTDYVFNIVRCSSCGLHYTNPRPSADEIGRYYSTSYSFHGVPSRLRIKATSIISKLANGPLAPFADIFPAIGRKLATHVKPSIADPVAMFYKLGQQGSFLDIGCGAGVSAHYWGIDGALASYKRLFKVAGVEVSPRAREALLSADIESWPNIHDVPDNRKFGIIRMNWSLEHVHSPSRYFSFMSNHLIPGGKIIIAVPNYDGLLYKIAPDCVELPIHLYHFRPQDLTNYAKKYGFCVDSLVTFSYPDMFIAAAKANMLPASFAYHRTLKYARQFQLFLNKLDFVFWGNDMIAILSHDK